MLSTPEFLGLSGDRTIFNILTARGVDVAPFSAVRREHEVLLPVISRDLPVISRDLPVISR